MRCNMCVSSCSVGCVPEQTLSERCSLPVGSESMLGGDVCHDHKMENYHSRDGELSSLCAGSHQRSTAASFPLSSTLFSAATMLKRDLT